MKTHIQLHDVQSHILRSARPSAASYLALSIVDVAAFLGWLSRVEPLLHSEQRLREARKREHTRDLPSPFFANIGFSASGLQALGLHPQLLERFALPFRKGMAARAAFIGDIGADAPEQWQGAWGHRSVHVFLALYFVSDQVPAAQRDSQKSPRQQLEQLLATLALDDVNTSGVIVLANEAAQVIRQEGRPVEHFGFKDGISQPYVNDGMAPHEGAGKRRAAGERWEPLATGEFLLGYPDELSLLITGVTSDEGDMPLFAPADPLERAWFHLTMNGSYLVYRKIEQDVVAFREKIVNELGVATAELMVGRQRNGAPLQSSSTNNEAHNDFDYSDDKAGAVCPMGSHIRRANPRASLDTSGSGSTRMVDQHRLIRRGMPYGAWLAPGLADDGQERGLHFLCYNANIETQFEFVQRNWINNSDFIGCPGAMVDPVVGNPAHAPHNPFSSSAMDLPLMGLPAVTRIRGGEYFFVPGLAGLAEIVALARQRTGSGEVILPDHAPVNDPFDAARILGLAQLAERTLYRALPFTLATGETRLFHYFADPQDVNTIMMSPSVFANDHYRRRINALTGSDMLLSMAPTGSRERLKQEMAAILGAENTEHQVKAAVFPTLKKQLHTFYERGEMDLVEDLARQMPLAFLKNYLGIEAPTEFPSPTEMAHFYDRTHVDDVPAEWRADYQRYLATFDSNPSGDDTLLFWVRMLFLEVFGNLWNVRHITTLATEAGKEFAVHLRRCVDRAFEQGGNATVLQRLVVHYRQQAGLTEAQQKQQVQQRLLEFAVGSTDTTMKAIANTVSTLLQRAPTLELAMIGILRKPEFARFTPDVLAFRQGDASKEPVVDKLLNDIIMSILRAYPVAPILVRDCPFGATFTLASSGRSVNIAPGSVVVTVLQAASEVARRQAEALVKTQPAGAGAGSAALPDFVFLDPGSVHGCMGKTMALTQIREVIKGLLALPQVRVAAGERGVMIEKYRLPAYQLLRCRG